MSTCIWITGKPGSGKTTLMKELAVWRPELQCFDAERIRSELYPELGFTDEDRLTNVKTLAFLARAAVIAGGNAVVAAVSPIDGHRETARFIIENASGTFVLVRLYGRRNKMWDGTLYEVPPHADMELDTGHVRPLILASGIIERYLQQPPRQLFIGRWQPFHSGHETIIREALTKGPVAIGVRTTNIDGDNPEDAVTRMAYIRNWFAGQDVEVFAMPDINSIHIGRDVGYGIVQHAAVPGVSGTELRKHGREDD